jgi:hypothetical protein
MDKINELVVPREVAIDASKAYDGRRKGPEEHGAGLSIRKEAFKTCAHYLEVFDARKEREEREETKR